MANRTYRERLLATGLDSLELRRLRYDLICTYKVLSNKLYTDDDGNMITSRLPALIDIDVDSPFSFNDFLTQEAMFVNFIRQDAADSKKNC